MPENDYLFISYSRRDSAEFVKRLVPDLQAAGIRVWLDMAEIRPGASWEQEITKGIGGAKALLYVASAHSANSSWMEAELRFVLDKGINVIPILVDDESERALPLLLQQYQWVDFRRDYKSALSLLISGLRSLLAIGAPSEPKPQKSKGYVFISYAEADSDFVTDLRTFLAERGYGFWDYESSDRDYHTQLFRELEGVIRESVATLSVLSEAWKESRWTIREYFFSEEVGTPVFLLRAKPISPTLAIAGVPYIDFVADTRRGFDKLDRELRRKGL